MKVTGAGGTGAATGARGARPAAPGFHLPSSGAAAGPAPTNSVGALNSVMGVDALLALQDVGGPLERKRRAVGRAGRMLDVLDDLRVALLGGELNGVQLERLARAIRDERAATDDPKLEAVLDEIEVRAAVELAKLEQARRAA